MSAPFVIETSGLTKRFGRRIAVDDVDLRVPRGSAFGYLEPNGLGDNSLQPTASSPDSAEAGGWRTTLRSSVARERSVCSGRDAVVRGIRAFPDVAKS
jgi:ABC-2 type transport system ATP-binding protein